MRPVAIVLIGILLFGTCEVSAQEKTGTETITGSEAPVTRPGVQVVVRVAPGTQRPFVSIVSDAAATEERFIASSETGRGRPDYRMLAYTVPRDTPLYEGPYSDRTKVYILAGALMTTGIATAAIGAAAPAALGAASSGAGAYAAAGTAVGVTTLATALIKARQHPDEHDFTHTSQTRLIEYNGF
jgi:hypothetical protein